MLLYTCKICKATEDHDRIAIDDQTVSRMYHLASGINDWNDNKSPILCRTCYANLCNYINNLGKTYEEEALQRLYIEDRDNELRDDFQGF